jgi:protein TonB
MFEDATFHSRGIRGSKTAQWSLLTLSVNLAMVATLIALPLIYPESLPTRLLNRVLYAPPVPPAQVPKSLVTASTHPIPTLNPYLAPTSIPTQISTGKDEPPPFTAMPSSPDGVVGGPEFATSVFQRTTPPTPVHQAAPTKITLSGGVTTGLLIYKTTPIYPAIARDAHISGTVVLSATISKTGTIENLHILSGHPMLTQSAIDAVKNWRYRPYQLNNQPVEVETTINVVFSMERQ